MNENTLAGMMTSERTDWATPPPFLEWIKGHFGFEPDLDAAAAAGKVRVFAILCDVSTLDANTDRNTDAQHDTAV